MSDGILGGFAEDVRRALGAPVRASSRRGTPSTACEPAKCRRDESRRNSSPPRSRC
nr:hypothetical protein [Haladaptatus sp. R4]